MAATKQRTAVAIGVFVLLAVVVAVGRWYETHPRHGAAASTTNRWWFM